MRDVQYYANGRASHTTARCVTCDVRAARRSLGCVVPLNTSAFEELPPADQRAVLKLLDAMLDTRRRSAPPPRVKRKAS